MALFEGEQPKFKEEQNLKDFLSDKYEKKRYYLDSSISSDRPKIAKEPSVTPQSSATNENSIWSTIALKQPVKIPNVSAKISLKANVTPVQPILTNHTNDFSSTSRCVFLSIII